MVLEFVRIRREFSGPCGTAKMMLGEIDQHIAKAKPMSRFAGVRKGVWPQSIRAAEVGIQPGRVDMPSVYLSRAPE